MSFSACVRAASRPTGWGVRSQTSEVAEVHTTCSSGVRYPEPCDLPRALQTQEREWTQCSAAPASRSLPRPQTAHTGAARTRQSHLHSVWMQHGRSVSSRRDCATAQHSPAQLAVRHPEWQMLAVRGGGECMVDVVSQVEMVCTQSRYPPRSSRQGSGAGRCLAQCTSHKSLWETPR